MLLYIVATCCITLAAAHRIPQLKIQDDDVPPALEWAESYKVQLTKTSLVAGIMEDIMAWKAKSSSRVDYNNGAVKVITLMANSLLDGDKYEIHPETRENEYNEIKCHNIGLKSNLTVKMDDMLPSLEHDYVFVGSENVIGTKTSKFEHIEKANKNKKRVKKTIWAVYEKQDDGSQGWTPFRYVEEKFDNENGALEKHYVFEYFEFYAGLDYVKDDVFDIETFGCIDTVTHDSNSESITKNLMFIDPEHPEHVDHVFKSFKTNFQRQYIEDNEHALRRKVFQNSMRLVSSINKKNLGYKLSINEFADRTPQEMKQHTGLLRRPIGKSGNIPFPYKGATLESEVDKLPEEYDMRLVGLISPVKHQGTCGSCWSFGTTAAVEGALARVNGGRVMSLANQALIDCAWDYAGGCGGGTDNGAYEWMMVYGLPTVEEYGPYENNDGFCNIRNMTKLYPIKGYTDVTPFSTSALKVALVNHGPLSVSVHVTDAFKLYSSGVYYERGCGPENLNHEVSLVGYGVKDGELFWILKNSWGPVWGIDGYMHISARDNNCGVETEPTYVVL